MSPTPCCLPTMDRKSAFPIQVPGPAAGHLSTWEGRPTPHWVSSTLALVCPVREQRGIPPPPLPLCGWAMSQPCPHRWEVGNSPPGQCQPLQAGISPLRVWSPVLQGVSPTWAYGLPNPGLSYHGSREGFPSSNEVTSIKRGAETEV